MQSTRQAFNATALSMIQHRSASHCPSLCKSVGPFALFSVRKSKEFHVRRDRKVERERERESDSGLKKKIGQEIETDFTFNVSM